MQWRARREITFAGSIRLHFLNHSSRAEIYALEMIQELGRHGYIRISQTRNLLRAIVVIFASLRTDEEIYPVNLQRAGAPAGSKLREPVPHPLQRTQDSKGGRRMIRHRL